MLKSSCIKSLWPVLISILGDENCLHLQSFSKWPVWLLSSIWGLSFSHQRFCNFCYTETELHTVSVTCVQVTFSNREKSTQCGPNACSFSVPWALQLCREQISSDHPKRQQAQLKGSTPRHKKSLLVPWASSSPPTTPLHSGGHTKHSHYGATGGK